MADWTTAVWYSAKAGSNHQSEDSNWNADRIMERYLSNTMRGCFKKAGFTKVQQEESTDTVDEDMQCTDDVPETWPIIQSKFEECGTFQGFAEADYDSSVAEDLSGEDL